MADLYSKCRQFRSGGQVTFVISVPQTWQLAGGLICLALQGSLRARRSFGRRRTRQAALEPGDPREIPPLYGQLVEYTRGYTLDNKTFVRDLPA